MSDKNQPDWLVKLKEVREKSDDPVVDGLVHIGQHTIDKTESLDGRIDKQAERIDEVGRQAAKNKDSVETQMETGFKAMADRIDLISKRNLITGGGGGGSVFSAGDRLMAVIPDQFKGLIYQAEQDIHREQRKSGQNRKTGLADPAFRAASELWFKNSLKLQLPRYFGGHQSELRQNLDKLEKAFEDMLPSTEQKAPYAEGSAGTGGNLVPVIVASEVLRIVEDAGVVVSRARHIPMTSDTLHIPNEATGVTVYWPGEAATLTAGEGTFGVNILEAKKIAGRAAASIEVAEDSVIGLLPYVQTVMAEKIGKTLDGEALEGTGTNFTGLNADGSVNSVATTTTDGEAVTFADLVNAVYQADESSVEDGAAWFMHRKIFGSIVNLTDNEGRPIFNPVPVDGAPRGTLLGFPVYTTSSIATDTTRGSTGNTSNIYFGDPRRMIFGDRRDLRFDVTETGPGWQYAQVDMRIMGRWGFTVGTPAAFSKIVGCTLLGA